LPIVKNKLNTTAIEERENDKMHQSMYETAKEDKDKHNKTFNNGSKDQSKNVSRAKAKKILENFDFNKLFHKNIG
jgi:hypothetical protein